MEMIEERKLLVEFGKKMVTSNLTKGTGGNISIYNSNKNLVAITPSGIDYFQTKPEDIVLIDLEGTVIEGNRKPSSEFKMHSIFYKNRKKDNINAVVHTHSIFATTIATLNWEIPSLHYLVAFAGIKVPCTKYVTYGTSELAENAYKTMGDEYKAVLLANHGLLSIGKNIGEAFSIAEIIEFMAEIYYRTKCIGDPVILDKKEMEMMIEKFKTYGQ